MNPPPQLLSPCPCAVHLLEGGASLCAVALGAWGLGAVTPVVSHGLWPLNLWYRWVYQPEAPALCLGLANL